MDISIPSLLFFFSILIIPLFINLYLNLKIQVKMLIAIIRMSVQLILVGIYLKYIFLCDNIFYNLIWMLVMIIVANMAIRKEVLDKNKIVLIASLLGFLLSLSIVLVFLTIIFDYQRMFSARYLIPISGMLLGNMMNSNIVAYNHLLKKIDDDKNQYIRYLTLGANRSEASIPFIKEAMLAALSPQIAGIATVGLVSLPGMMTGQILGGMEPWIAVKYQLVIMIAILSSVYISIFIGIKLVFFLSINKY